MLIPISTYAIDYRDSTGYTPSWAIGQGYHYVLNECNYLIGDTSRDGNWCYEWVAYVLDQGVENFPESTKSSSSSTSTSNLSERICSENKICVFPGEFLKYKNWDTYDNFEEIAVMEFKEKVNEDNIKFFADGFGSKPLTYNLNLKTGMETHSQYDTNRPFNFIEPIPMKIGQDVYRIIGNFYETKIEAEMPSNLKEIGLMDIERTVMAARIDYGADGEGGLVFDKETGVLLTQIEKYVLDGKEYTAGIVLIDTNIFSVPTKLTSTKTTTPKVSEPIITKAEPPTSVPTWIKNNAGWWADGVIDDDSFVQGIQYLVKEKIINVVVPTTQTSSSDQNVPDWIKNNAGWWADGSLSENDFLNGIQYLVESGIIYVENLTPRYTVSENYHGAVLMINAGQISLGSDVILTIIDPDLNKNENMIEHVSLDQITVTVNGVKKIQLSDMNPVYSNFIETDFSSSIFQNTFAVGIEKFSDGDVVEFSYFDDTLYTDEFEGDVSVSIQVVE